MVRRDDGQKAGRMRYLFDVDLHDPALYDVMINMGVLSQGGRRQPARRSAPAP
jgi:hypothetical protein